jgi:diacylglycerol kinase family enzyme
VLIGTGVPLGVVPRGTANAFSVALGIPTPLDDTLSLTSTFAKRACDVIMGGHTIDVDTALVTTSEVTDYPMILLLGIGFEAEVVKGADRDLKNTLGPLAYILSGEGQRAGVCGGGGGRGRGRSGDRNGARKGRERGKEKGVRRSPQIGLMEDGIGSSSDRGGAGVAASESNWEQSAHRHMLPATWLLPSPGAKELLTTTNFKAKGEADGEKFEGEAAALTVANAAPPFSVLAHGHVGECIYDDGKLEAIAYTASSSKIDNVINMGRFFAETLFGDQPVKDENIQGGRYKDIYVECDPPQKVVLDGEMLGEWGWPGAGRGIQGVGYVSRQYSGMMHGHRCGFEACRCTHLHLNSTLFKDYGQIMKCPAGSARHTCTCWHCHHAMVDTHTHGSVAHPVTPEHAI